MRLARLKDLFARFLRTRRFGRHFRRFALLHGDAHPESGRPQLSASHAEELLSAARAEPDALLTALGSHADGLTEPQAASLRARYGPNEIHHEKPLPWWLHLWHCYRTPFDLLLTVLAVISWITEDYKATAVISSMVVLSVGLRFWQEHRSSRAADALKAMVGNTATVMRRDLTEDAAPVFEQYFGAHVRVKPASRIDIPIGLLVPGDIVLLSAGDMIPADCRLLHARDLFINQSAMTGESLPVEKFANIQEAAPRDALDLANVLYMGTNVVSGSGTAIVLSTGARTYFGALAQRVSQADSGPTQFQSGVNHVAWLLIRFMFVMAPLVLLVNGLTKHDWSQAMLFALSIAVGLTPEMLPMIATSTLAKGAVFLSRKKVIVKRLDAIQNLGAMNVLCVDKTGTLTQDRVVLARHLDGWGDPSDRVLQLAYLNSRHQTGLRNLLDVAVLEHVEADREAAEEYRLVDEIPFDFQRRRMSVVVAEDEGHHLIVCKGAIEEVLSVCSRIRQGETDALLTAEVRERTRTVTGALNREGMRVVAVAIKEVPAAQKDYRVPDECDLTLVGYVSFLDPPKDSAAPALRALARHGIGVKVLTGDNELVTEKVCRDVGLVPEGVLMGSDIEGMSDADLADAVQRRNVFAKLTPAHKERLVRSLRSHGHVVGFMGDGINDAPALRAADVGISVDTAVDIAKEAADIILLDKSLLVLDEGVMEGRATFANMLKYIRMTASSNFGNVLSVLIASAFLPFLPMLPVHFLLQNLLYDISQSAIPFDRVDDDMLRDPQRWNPAAIGRFMLWFGPVSSVFDVAAFGFLWFVLGADTPAEQTLFQSGWFVFGLLTQALVVHTIRTRKVPFVQSRAAAPLVAMTAAVAAAGVFVVMGPLASSFKLQPLPPVYFVWLPVALLAYLTLAQAAKALYARRWGWP